MSTDENLKEAFAGESQANRRYMAFAKKAEEDGFSKLQDYLELQVTQKVYMHTTI
jgi:rubrerythrin